MIEIFVFSSRRRHTRSYGDWSSDVCSSDLAARKPGGRLAADIDGAVCGRRRVAPHRSEECRVGKECRSWWSPVDLKKKEGRIGYKIGGPEKNDVMRVMTPYCLTKLQCDKLL